MKKIKAAPHVGIFGEPQGLSFAVEEQGRKTLHVHMSVWISLVREWQDGIFFGTQGEKRSCKKKMQDYSERVCSTKMFSDDVEVQKRAWDHNCSEPMRYRNPPMVVPDQELRNLRNKAGHKDTK